MAFDGGGKSSLMLDLHQMFPESARLIFPSNYSFGFPRLPQSDYRSTYMFGISELEAAYERRMPDIHHWYTEQGGVLLSLFFGALYLSSIVSIKYWMQNREAFQLRGCLAVWNISLALFSFLGAVRTVPETLDVISTGGALAAACNDRAMTLMWTQLFAWSKVPEMGDTIFILLRKQKLIFLHWYHHLVTMLYCWLCIAQSTATGRGFMVMNYVVHTMMYSYYALRACKIRVPRAMAAGITTLQLLQMFVGFGITVYTLSLKRLGVTCMADENNLIFGFLMYLSYIILFSNFFYQSYMKKSSSGQSTSASTRCVGTSDMGSSATSGSFGEPLVRRRMRTKHNEHPHSATPPGL